jgi:hypothetical protein
MSDENEEKDALDEEEQPGSEVDKIISLTFKDFDKAIVRLEAIPVSAEKKTRALLDSFGVDERAKLFSEPEEFYRAMNDLSEEIGHAYHTVLAIELARQKINPQIASDLFESVSRVNRPSNQSPIVIQGQASTTPQLGVLSGAWYYAAERARSKAMVEAIKESKDTPQISTGKQVVDVLEFGRQLVPEFNRVYEWFHCSIDHLYFFNDADTMERLTGDLQKHMNKLAGIVRIFCRTITEYRKELYGERKRDIARGAVAMKITEAQNLGAMRMSDFYRSVREAAGEEDAGG